MEVYNPVFKITWPAPGTSGIAIVLVFIIALIVSYAIIKYLITRERDKLQVYQHFLLQMKRKGLNSRQINIFKNMTSFLHLPDQMPLVKDPSLFESALPSFIEKRVIPAGQSEEQPDIYRDLVIIYDRLYVTTADKQPLDSITGIEPGHILYISTEKGIKFLGKMHGSESGLIAVQPFTGDNKVNSCEAGESLIINLIRLNDGEYTIKTKCAGLKDGRLLAELSDEIVKVKEYRHPYKNVIIPCIITSLKKNENEEDTPLETTIFRINESECELRSPAPLIFNREYMLEFEISGYLFKVLSQVIAARIVESEKVYYIIFKFAGLTKPASAVLSSFIVENL